MSGTFSARGPGTIGARSLLWAAAAAVGLSLLLEPQHVVSGEQRYVIPPGTARRAEAGESVENVMPQHIRTVVGRPLVVENRDTQRHVFGPFVLDPGQQWRRTFAAPGDVQMACSLYPATGFTIAVAPSPTPASRTTALLSAWLVLLTAAAAAAVGAVGVGVGLGAGEGVGARDPDPSRDPHDRPDRPDRPDAPDVSDADVTTARAHAAAAWALNALPALTTGAAALAVVRLTRAARWTDVVGSRALLAWWAAMAFALAAAWFGRRLRRRQGPASGDGHAALAAASDDGLFGVGLALAAVACAWGPFVGAWAAASAAVATAGGGLLAAAAVRGAQAGAAGRRRLIRHVAVPGLALLAVALPSGPVTPPVQALSAVPKLAAAIGLLGWARVLGRRREATAAQGMLAAATLGLLLTGGLLYGALLGHLNAVTLPITGNAVAMSDASAERGAAIWTAECAACHADASVFRAAPSDVLLRAMTFGKGTMPAFKYRLDIFQRGDVVNYLRGEASGSGP